MYSKVLCGTTLGIEGLLISVETDMSMGLPGLVLVGYLSSSVKEAGDRVRAALKNVGYYLPSQRITINLSPADIRKDGSLYDLAIAVSILISMGEFPIDEKLHKELDSTLFLGELGLDGSVLRVNGVLPIVDYAFKHGITRVVLPRDNAREASAIRNLKIVPVTSLTDIIDTLKTSEWKEYSIDEYLTNSFDRTSYGNSSNNSENRTSYGNSADVSVDRTSCDALSNASVIDTQNLHMYEKTYVDLKEIKGQESMKRGVIIAVAGFHNVLLTGAAGSGKSMIAKCIPGIMPELTYDESVELTKVYSVAGMLNPDEGLMKSRPIRCPHQNITQTALCGGGIVPMPGEISLSNGGVLFLDEISEFPRGVIESLRQPLEDRQVTISRLKGTFNYPARFMLVAARNNCPCGFYPDRTRCRCTEGEIFHYQNKVSHPLMDRIDIRLEIKPVGFKELTSVGTGISSEEARQIICSARKIQEKRFEGSDILYNSMIPQGMMDRYIKLSDESQEYIRYQYEKSDMSARGYYRVLKLARTIADINEHSVIETGDLQEAIFYRNNTEYR